MRKFLLSSLLFVATFSFGQIEEIRRITQTLCSPEFHGRGYVKKGDSIAAEFIASEFKKIGLKPIDKSYFQAFPLIVNTFPSSVSIQSGGKLLLPGIHFLIDPASAGGNMELKPKIIEISTALNQEKLQNELIEIINGNVYNSVAFNFTKLSADTLKKIAGLTEIVAGILPVIEVMDHKFTWSVANEQLKFPLIHVQDSIFNESNTFHINIESSLIKDYVSRNVYGFLPAKKKTKKTLIYSAHYDHLGRMGINTYFPGANDNASGTALLINMAAYFKENPVDYNLLFIAFAGEEAGLVGSKFFVENPPIKLENISFLMNLDIMGSGEDGVTIVNATLFDKEFKLLQQINKEQKLLTQIKSRGPAANSDHYWFTQNNVPSFFMYTMGLNKNYHDIFDTYENLSFAEYQDITTLLIEFTTRFGK
jgi:hypothetical protein